jgi:hypothetical protein
MDECRRRGWLVIHSRMDRKTTTDCGVCDFIIFTDITVEVNDWFKVYITLLIEAKSKQGKLSPSQLAFAAHAKKMGHTIQVVRSFEEFLKLL